jgi:hypothetical protein
MKRLFNAAHHQHNRLRTDFQNVLEVSNSHPAVARTEKEYRFEPNVHENMARFEHRIDLDGERLSALVALVCADPRTRPIEFACSLRAATARTNCTLRPNATLYKLVSFFLSVEA